MIARVTWGKIKPGKWDEFERLWNGYASENAGSPGMRGRILLRDQGNADAGYGVSFWDDSAAFETFRATMPAPPAMQDCFVGQYVTTVTTVSGATLPGLT